MANETALGLAWIVATLEGDTPLASDAPGGVHRGTAPVGTPTPYIIVNQQSGGDITTANRVRLFSAIQYQVKACGPASDTASIVAAADRIDTLIDDKSNQAVTGGIILSSSRDEPLAYDEDEPDGTKFSHFGGLYALQVQRL
jgi:hypothetical protein